MLLLNSCRVRRFTLIVAVILAAVIGSMASTSAGTDSWYLLLDKSELNPPSYVFGIVWPIYSVQYIPARSSLGFFGYLLRKLEFLVPLLVILMNFE